MYQYAKGKDLLDICSSRNLDLSEAAIRAEIEESGTDRQQVWQAMAGCLEVMEQSVQEGLTPGVKSIGGLIGGGGRLVHEYALTASFCGPTVLRALGYALAITEVNAAMGRIVAAPTAGSSGIVPGVLLALYEERHYLREQVIKALFVAGAIGKVIALNATLSGAEGGCQAECGSAAAMAASAAVYLGGGSPPQCLDAAAIVLKSVLGLVCDPVGGLVEVPCSKRNGTGAVNALVCADMVLAGLKSFIPFDEMVTAMYQVGRKISPDLRETARGGCAATPTALEFSMHISG